MRLHSAALIGIPLVLGVGTDTVSAHGLGWVRQFGTTTTDHAYSVAFRPRT
jgi:hypothetical protein